MSSMLNPQESDQDKKQFEAQAEQAVNQTNTASQGEQASDNTPPKMEPASVEAPSQANSNHLTVETLPQEAKNSLPEEAQHLFIAAYNSILENNGDEQTAARVAWQTIETNEHYERSQDGKWQRLPDTAAQKGGDRTMIHETAP